MNRIIPDTNFLIYLVKFKLLDKLENYKEILLLKQVLAELVVLSKSEKEKVVDRERASLALQFLEKIGEKVKFVNDIDSKADDAVLELGMKEKKTAIVGTMDKELVKRLKKEGIKVLIIRQKKYLEER
jgi:rRNA-processing protein FCF1